MVSFNKSFQVGHTHVINLDIYLVRELFLRLPMYNFAKATPISAHCTLSRIRADVALGQNGQPPNPCLYQRNIR